MRNVKTLLSIYYFEQQLNYLTMKIIKTFKLVEFFCLIDLQKEVLNSTKFNQKTKKTKDLVYSTRAFVFWREEKLKNMTYPLRQNKFSLSFYPGFIYFVEVSFRFLPMYLSAVRCD